MLNEVLDLLKKTVNEHLATTSGVSAEDSDQGQVVFLSSERADSLDFKLGAVTLLLANVEEEHAARPDDPQRRVLLDGTTRRAAPAIHLNLYVLFVARFRDYPLSMRYISLILKFFLSRRVLDHENTPALDDRIEKLTMELVTLPFSELNHLWGILRTAYLPSLLYKVRMVVYEDEEGMIVPPIVETITKVVR